MTPIQDFASEAAAYLADIDGVAAVAYTPEEGDTQHLGVTMEDGRQYSVQVKETE